MSQRNGHDVTVVIPLYNKGLFVSRSIESVLEQTYPNFRVIVVDDGSEDEGPAKVKAFTDHRIEMVRQNNRGPGAARNRGLSLARSPFIAFLDADDEWMPRFLETGIDILEKTGISIVCSGFFKYPEGTSSEEIFPDLQTGVYLLKGTTDTNRALKLWRFMSPCNSVYRTESIRKYGGYYDKSRIQNGEDGHLQLKLLLNEAIYVERSPLVKQHTECSELYIPHKSLSALPLPAYLLDPRDIEKDIDDSERSVLRSLLSRLALHQARHQIVRGEIHRGIRLIHEFADIRLLPHYAMVVLLIFLSPAIRLVRKVNRLIEGKRLVANNRIS